MGYHCGGRPTRQSLYDGDRLRHVVVVLAFGVDELAEAAGLVDLPHGVAVVVEGRRLEHHVLPAAGLDRLEQLVGVLERAEDGRHGRGHVLAVLEHLDAVPGVARGVGGHEDGLDRVVLDQLFQRRIGLLAAAGLGQLRAAVGNQVADGRHRDVRMVLEAERRAELADAVADDAHADLAVGDRLPDALGALGGLHARRPRGSSRRAFRPRCAEHPSAAAAPSEPRPTCCRNDTS